MNFFCDLRLHAQNISSGKPDILWFARETMRFSLLLLFMRICVGYEESFFFKKIGAE